MRYVVGLSGGVTQDFVQCVRMACNDVGLRGDAVVQGVVRGLQSVDLGFQCIQWRRRRHAFHNREFYSVNANGEESADCDFPN